MENQTATEYRLRQAAQLRKFRAWRQAEGGIELPVTLHTFLKPQQQARIAWLVEGAVGRVLEVGCSWGYVLAQVHSRNPGEHVGLDKTAWNVELARRFCPELEFEVGDARDLKLRSKHFDTVLLAEVLEHLLWPDEVKQAIQQAIRVARQRVLITFPDGEMETDEATSMKHAWLADREKVAALSLFLRSFPENRRQKMFVRGGFVHIRLDLTQKRRELQE